MSAVSADGTVQPTGRELDAVLAFVGRVRRRARALDLAAGAAACASGGIALVLGMLVPAASYWCAVPALVSVAGLGVALAGALMTARAVFGPPAAGEVADWIERATPELRDSLATSVEGGPLAGVSARYAAPRLARVPEAAVGPPGRRGARALVLAASAVVLGAGVLARAIVPPASTVPRPGAAAPTAKVPHPGVDTTDVRKQPVRPEAAASVKASVPDRTGGVEVIVRAGPGAAAESPARGRAKAGEVLVSSPAGFERAVELFMDGLPEQANDGTDRR